MIAVFYNETLYNVVARYQYCKERVVFYLNMGTTCTSKMLVPIYQTSHALFHISKGEEGTRQF